MNAHTAIAADTALKLRGIHHSAFRCRDAEETRAFYEDVLGFPLAAALIIEPGGKTVSRDQAFMHLFFELNDGNYIAFFDVPKGASEDKFAIRDGLDLHFAMEASSLEQLKGWQDKLNAAGYPCAGPINHEFCHSIYFADPNGLALEITCRDQAHDAVMAHEAASARQQIKDWTARKAAAKA
jgi:catechol 2,3-dioxygenase-like lactoylglutathione lyase family enzyme